MSFSWSTFFIEIVNFAVLVWLLTRLLYQPVMRTLDARRRSIDEERKRAEDDRAAAAELVRRYDARLADWEKEKQQLRDSFERSLAEERIRREAELQAALERERQRAEAARLLRERDEERRLRQQASQEAARFGARLLSRIASPEVERRLIAATVEDLAKLSSQERATLARAFDGRGHATVTTRYGLADGERQKLEDALAGCFGVRPTLTFAQDDALVSGIRVEFGAATLEGNLAAELRWFAKAQGDVAD